MSTPGGTPLCEDCSGSGVRFTVDEWGNLEIDNCTTCERFQDPLVAARFVQDLVNSIYTKHEGANLCRTVTKCVDCPCHFVNIDSWGDPTGSRCNLLGDHEDLYHDVDTQVAPDCPLKKYSITLRLPGSTI